MNKLRSKEASRLQMQRAARLHKREQRSRYHQTLVEGPQAVRELLACAPALVRDVYYTEQAFTRHPDIRALAVQTQVYVHPVSENDFFDMSRDAQGILAVIDEPEPWGIDDILGGASLVMLALEISDPGNLGTLIRVSDAAGVDAVILGKGSVELYSPKVIRATAGSIFHLPVLSGMDMREMSEAGRAHGFQILAADAHGAYSLDDLMFHTDTAESAGSADSGDATLVPPSLTAPTMWVLGNEARGFAGVDMSLMDNVVSIPIYGQAESLNVSIAGGILAYSTVMARATR